MIKFANNQIDINRRNQKSSKSGMALMDFVMFMIVVSAVAYGIFALATQGSSKNNVMTAQTNLSIIRDNVRNQFQGETDFANLTTAIAINGGCVPKNWETGTTIRHGWGGTITLAPSGSNTEFDITMTEVPKDGCSELGKFRKGDWANVTVNGTSIPQSGTSVLILDQACTDSDNTLVFTSTK